MALTFVVPSYGKFDYLASLVQSIFNQSNSNWVLIVVSDDSLSEQQINLLNPNRDPRVQIHLNEARLGLNGNFQKCLGLVRTPFFCMPGQDDLVHHEFVERFMKDTELLGGDFAIWHPRVDTIDKNGDAYTTLGDKVKGFLRPKDLDDVGNNHAQMKRLMLGNWMYFPAIVWNTALVKRIGFRDGYDIALDLLLIMEILFSGGKIRLCNDYLFKYRRHSLSYSMRADMMRRRFLEEIKVHKIFADKFWHNRQFSAWAIAKLALSVRLNYGIIVMRRLIILLLNG